MRRSDSNLSLFLRMVSKMPSLRQLLARLMLLTPCMNSVMRSKPATLSLLLQSLSPLILCILRARCTYSTTLSLGRLHSDKSKKSERVFLVNQIQIFQGSFIQNGFTYVSGITSLGISLVVAISLAVGLFTILGVSLQVSSEVGRRMCVFGELVNLCTFAEFLGFSFYTLLTDLRCGCCLRGVKLVLPVSPLICLEMLEMSAYRLVLLMRELCASTIQELVQSMNGFTSDSSSIELIIEVLGVCLPFLSLKTFYSHTGSPYSLIKHISDSFQLRFLVTSWLDLLSSSTKINPSVTIYRGP